MAGPNHIEIEDIVNAVHLDAANPDHVELFKHRLSIATSDAAKKMLSWGASTKMLITAVLCDTWSPQRMATLADLVLNASSEAAGNRTAFTNLFLANMEYERIASVGNLDDAHKARIELGYALAACLPLLSREALEKIAISFSDWVKEDRMKQVRSVIDIVRAQDTAGPGVIAKRDRPTMTEEKRSRYIQEMDQIGLLELLSRLTLARYHQDEVRKEALAQLSKKTWGQ